MRNLLIATAILAALATPALADGDIAKGETTFKKCKSCHALVSGDGTVIVKGGKTGPNLFGVIGRIAGSEEDFKYGATLVAAGEAGLVWDQDQLARYVVDPKAFLKEVTGDGAAKSKMTFKLKKGGEDVAAYLATLAPAAASDGETSSLDEPAPAEPAINE